MSDPVGIRPCGVVGQHVPVRPADQQLDLQRYSFSARKALLWQFDGISE
ncbi:hypothetical protein ACFP5Z_01580 [Kocuria oceani]